MIQFEPVLLFAHALVFPIFLFLFSRYVIAPVFTVLERRRGMLNVENQHAFGAARTRAELKERCRREIEEVHRNGGVLLVNTKTRATQEAQRYLEEVREQMHRRMEEKKDDIEQVRCATAGELDARREELLKAITCELWGEREA